MRSFIHGGRVGDAICALYTVKELGGGIFNLCLYHAPHNWSLQLAEALLPLIRYQRYVERVSISKIPLRWIKDHNKPYSDIGSEPIDRYTHDLMAADTICNPERFPELVPGTWPGNVHVAKRYADHFAVKWDPETIWLEAPKTLQYDVVFHCPLRRSVRSKEDWLIILDSLSYGNKKVLIIGGSDIDEWEDASVARYSPANFLETAAIINSTECFLGVSSSCSMIAEALKKKRYVELSDESFNTYPYGETGRMITGKSNGRVVEMVLADE